jgi:hypothetical protein
VTSGGRSPLLQHLQAGNERAHATTRVTAHGKQLRERIDASSSSSSSCRSKRTAASQNGRDELLSGSKEKTSKIRAYQKMPIKRCKQGRPSHEQRAIIRESAALRPGALTDDATDDRRPRARAHQALHGCMLPRGVD